MRIVSFGEIYVDYYFSNDVVLGISGGKSNANIIANLASFYDVSFFGVVGNDIQGSVSVNSLSKLGVDVSNVLVLPERTKMSFVKNSSSLRLCPYCGRRTVDREDLFDEDWIINLIQKDDFIVLDSLSDKVFNVLNSLSNKVFLNLNYLGDLLYLGLDELVSLFQDKFSIIQLSSKVMNKLRSKFNLDLVDFYELVRPDILIIHKGDKGADIVYNSIVYEKEVVNSVNAVDLTGASDAFFDQFIRTIIEADFNIDERVISLAFMRASSSYQICSLGYGARSHLQPLNKIKEYNECICNEITLE